MKMYEIEVSVAGGIVSIKQPRGVVNGEHNSIQMTREQSLIVAGWIRGAASAIQPEGAQKQSMKGNLVVLELIALGLSQMEIEKRSGVKQSTISCLKRGTRKNVGYEKVVALERLLEQVKSERADEGVFTL
ncbi:hypothetical protein ACQUFY_10890 [Robbsia andropogonis]|uniref:hypothetical protein n=1 Tax=Robbsia andropogonis TaxID=28092 RepID=UPI003D20C8A2